MSYSDNMKKVQIIIGSFVILLCVVGSNLSGVYAASADSGKDTVEEPPTITTVGALGRIEPRSRVIALSHDKGPEGARVEKLQVVEGQSVKAGDIIAIFSDNELKKTQLEIARMKVDIAKSALEAEIINQQYYQNELNRDIKLAKSNVVSVQAQEETRKNFDQSSVKVKSLEAELRLARANVDSAMEELEQTMLRAPLDGTIIEIHTWEGERIGDRGAVEIADLSKLDVVTEVYERDMPRVKVGQKAEIIIPGFKEPFYGEVRELGFKVVKSTLDSVNPLATIDNRVIEVRITLESGEVESEKLKHLIYMEVDVRLL